MIHKAARPRFAFLIALALVFASLLSAHPAEAIRVAVYVDGFRWGDIEIDDFDWWTWKFWYGSVAWSPATGNPWGWSGINGGGGTTELMSLAERHAEGRDVLVIAPVDGAPDLPVYQIAVAPGTLDAFGCGDPDAILSALPKLVEESDFYAYPYPYDPKVGYKCPGGYRAKVILRSIRDRVFVFGVQCIPVDIT
jgi:hypothetical protein